ncbi:YxiJ-like family protein [Ktedonospora formicarum]|uniref:Uncharacterized protein n=1 Tax=Ktedonospora formicarum TaxID=2778364 RepID=A0A8J3IDF5_9CHLR|nr:YxiJ-like family protein [Ktedonospora formicarum]GHO51165.1 hypothetical protein KSX_93280 [Ktedonospora formicarum]
METENALRKELQECLHKMPSGFPYRDMRNMRKDPALQTCFLSLTEEEDQLSPDFNTYCAGIEGTASYIVKGKIAHIPPYQLQWLRRGDFFDMFPQYRFLRDALPHYAFFFQMYALEKRMQEIERELVDLYERASGKQIAKERL